MSLTSTLYLFLSLIFSGEKEKKKKEPINKEEGELSDEDEDESMLRQEPKTVCRFNCFESFINCIVRPNLFIIKLVSFALASSLF